MIYDTAVRIGAKLDMSPDRVYLHAGTRAGARVLGLEWRADSVELSALPSAFRGLPGFEVEDILCIYKHDLLRVVSAADWAQR
jgi:hypothetical protein